MKRFCILVTSLFLTACMERATADGIPKEGRSKFEIFGMKDEYLMVYGDRDGKTIERFDPGESVPAAHFEKLLPSYCAEEGIKADFIKKVDGQGFTYFLSPTITADILSHYTQVAKLKDSEFLGASSEDLQRYVFGAYTRDNYKRAAIICAANSPSKVHNLAKCLYKLGCADVHVYRFDAVPISNIVVFSPTENVRKKLGIKNEISFAELNKAFQNDLKADDQASP